MKKIVLFIINLCCVVFIILFINFLFMHIPNAKYNNATPKETFEIYKNFLQTDLSPEYAFDSLIATNQLRKVENPDSKAKPIVIFGCSYVYGSDIEENQTLSYKLGKLTKRPIYNRAQGGLGVQHMLYQLQNNEFYKIVPLPQNNEVVSSNSPEYVLYVFIHSHYSRMMAPVCSFCPICYTAFYKKDKNNNFVYKRNNPILSKIVIYPSILNHVIIPYLLTKKVFKKKMDNELFDYIIASKKEAEKHWTDTKFAIFFFNDTFDKNTMKRLEENGIILISQEDYKINPYEEKYMATLHKDHPDELFWDTVVPVIIDKLKLNKE